MRKPSKPSRPAKPNRKNFFKRNRLAKRSVSLSNNTGFKTHMTLRNILDAAKDISEVELENAYVKCVDQGMWGGWHIKLERERPDHEVEQLYEEALNQHEQRLGRYRIEMERYKVDMEKWKQAEMERISAEMDKVQAKYNKTMRDLEKTK